MVNAPLNPLPYESGIQSGISHADHASAQPRPKYGRIEVQADGIAGLNMDYLIWLYVQEILSNFMCRERLLGQAALQ